MRYLGGTECGAGTESKVDTDGDGIPDIWETNGIDIDKDGKPELDLPAMGANPQRKDVFVEIDWMNADPACTKSRLLCAVDDRRNEAPTPEAIKQVVDAFASAPVSNPNGSTGITLHVDYGPESPKADGKPWGALAHGSKIPFKESIGSYSSKGYDWTEFEQIRDKNSEQVRRAVFRYTIFGYAYAGAFKSSGFAALPGNRMMVTSHDWPWPLGDEAGTFMHELGHNLGLKHGGDKNVDYNEGYYSVMNYDFQFPGVDEKGKLDYSTGKTDYKLPLIEDKARNRHPGRGGVVPPLDTFDDWSNLKFDGHGIGALGASVAEDEEQVVHEVSIEDMPVRPGAAGVAMIGPTLVAQGVDRQVLIADITNLSSVASDYTLRLDVPWAKEPLAVEVPAETTGRVEIPIAVAEVHEAAVPVTASLYHGKELMSTSAIDINVVDLSDPIQAQAVSETLAEIAADPLPGLDPGVVAALDSTIAPEVGLENLAEQVAENTDAGSSLPIPRWALGALGGGVLLLLLLAVRMVRSKKA